MNDKRSRTDEEKELEMEMLIRSKTITSYFKIIQKTRGRKKIQTLIDDLSEEIDCFNKDFSIYSKSIKQ